MQAGQTIVNFGLLVLYKNNMLMLRSFQFVGPVGRSGGPSEGLPQSKFSHQGGSSCLQPMRILRTRCAQLLNLPPEYCMAESKMAHARPTAHLTRLDTSHLALDTKLGGKVYGLGLWVKKLV